MKNISRILVFSVICLFIASSVYAQDIVVTMDAKSIKAKVLEINDQEIKYKDFENPDGPIYVMKKSEINMIVYQNGKVETFNNIPNENQNYNQNSNNPAQTSNLPKILSYDELMNMDDDEKETYLSTLGVSNIYETFKEGNELAAKGRRLRYTGIGLSVGGAILYFYGISAGYMIEEEAMIIGLVGGAACIVGEVLTIVSIPISATGGSKKYAAENMYKDFTMGTSFSYIQPKLNFGLTHNGVGLTLKF